jgi:hypothetical protein
MANIIIIILLSLWSFWPPSDSWAQSQNSLPNTLEQNKSSSNEPLDRALDSSQYPKENSNSSDKIPKIGSNKTKFNSCIKTKSSNYRKSKDPGTELKPAGNLRGGYGQQSGPSKSSALLPFSTYLNDNKIENSLDKSLNSGLAKKARSKKPAEDETLIGNKRIKRLQAEDMKSQGRLRKQR